ncbi:hypothetical protein X801_03908 [Opisthorchis viverrini]|uniref:Uncharacterized protein n=1 Tax=Opisthorchis viverrini TaxID=6198 RepID=A0A1S8X0L8_OPIVI|nr:hypothetical protein X801_03908 [Opisthorchis viverrini]
MLVGPTDLDQSVSNCVCAIDRCTRCISIAGKWCTWFSTPLMTSDQNRDTCAQMSLRKSLLIQARC